MASHEHEPDDSDMLVGRIYSLLSRNRDHLILTAQESGLDQNDTPKEGEFCVEDRRNRLYVLFGEAENESYFFVQKRKALLLARRTLTPRNVPVEEYIFSFDGANHYYGGRSYVELTSNLGVKRDEVEREELRTRSFITPRELVPLVLCLRRGQYVPKSGYDEPIAGSIEKVFFS